MIRYHVMSLLCLAVAAVAAIEALAGFTVDADRLKIVWYTNTPAWVMTGLFVGCILMYYRLRRKRKEDVVGKK
ncbi:MAG: hypothetical protein RIT07_406 [Bacteroidota bacterium]